MYIHDLLGNHGVAPWTYPGGEEGIRATYPAADAVGFARIRSSQDLVRVLLALQAAQLNDMKFSKLLFPYLPYARQDRVAVRGDPNAAAWLGKVMRASLGPDLPTIFTYDLHSKGAKNWFEQSGLLLTPLSPVRFIRRYIKKLAPRDSVVLVSPDKGAADKTSLYAAVLGTSWVQMDKVRDPQTGKLTGFKPVDTISHKNQISVENIDASDTVIVVDDICDGGGTFIGVADGLLDQGIDNVPHLWTTHGIYSKGFDALATKYKSVACLDSFQPKSYYETLDSYDKFLTVFEHDFLDDFLIPTTQGF